MGGVVVGDVATLHRIAAVKVEAQLLSIVDQLVFWTYGIWLSTARDRQSARFSPTMLLTPNIVVMVLALAFVIGEIPLPHVLAITLGTIGDATSARCMMYLGMLVCLGDVLASLKCPVGATDLSKTSSLRFSH